MAVMMMINKMKQKNKTRKPMRTKPLMNEEKMKINETVAISLFLQMS